MEFADCIRDSPGGGVADGGFGIGCNRNPNVNGARSLALPESAGLWMIVGLVLMLLS